MQLKRALKLAGTGDQAVTRIVLGNSPFKILQYGSSSISEDKSLKELLTVSEIT